MSTGPPKDQFDRDGFVVVPSLLSDGDFAELVANIDRFIREVVPHLPDGDAFYVDRSHPETLKQLHRLERDPFFRESANHPTWSGLARSLLGEDVETMAVEWFDKPPGTPSPTPPHQDNYYFNLKPPLVVTLWMALDPVDEENGGLRYIAGSHRRGLRPHSRSGLLGFSQGIGDYGPEDAAREAPIRLRPNDVVAHHGETIHRADPNRSEARHRRAFAMVFRGVSCRRDEEGFARYQASLRAQNRELGLKT